MSRASGRWLVPAAVLFMMVLLSLGSAVAVLTVEGIGLRVSEVVSRMTGLPTVYGAREATRQRLDVVQQEQQSLRAELEQRATALRDCEHDRAALPALLAEHSEQQRRLAQAARVTRLLHSSINLGLSRHLQSTTLKAVPAFGTGVVTAMTVAEMGLLCYQHGQVAELRRALAPDAEAPNKPLVCRLGIEALATVVNERILRRDEPINWRDECQALEMQGVPMLDCDRFPTQGPVDPDAWIGQATNVESVHPVDPDAWIRQNVEREVLRPVDPR